MAAFWLCSCYDTTLLAGYSCVKDGEGSNTCSGASALEAVPAGLLPVGLPQSLQPTQLGPRGAAVGCYVQIH